MGRTALRGRSETATIRGLRHCDLLHVDVYNHTATSGLGLRLQLDVATTRLVLALALALLIAPTAHAQLPPLPIGGEFEQVTLAMGAETAGEPIGLAVLPNGDAIHTSRDGRVFYTTVEGDTTVAARVPVYTHDEDGLQAVAVDPDFEQTGWIYLYYAPRLDTPADNPARPASTRATRRRTAPTRASRRTRAASTCRASSSTAARSTSRASR